MRMAPNDESHLLHYPLLDTQKDIIHFSTTRKGGISTGNYAEWNLGEYCGDEPEAVGWNRAKLCRTLSVPVSRLCVASQVHQSEYKIIDNDFLSLTEEEKRDSLNGFDALITRTPGVCVAVSTADCVPVLLYAPDKKVVAAVHAGWRGTVLQIVPKVVACLVEEFQCVPEKMLAVLGPSICKDCFEVGEEVVNAFRMIGSDMKRILSRNPETDKAHIDLQETNRLQLIQAGLLEEHIEVSGLCSYTQSEQFFSARRQGLESGRMLTGILLKEESK